MLTRALWPDTDVKDATCIGWRYTIEAVRKGSKKRKSTKEAGTSADSTGQIQVAGIWLAMTDVNVKVAS